MCGIAGLFDLSGQASFDRDLLGRMNQAQFHRGPDEGGDFLEPGVALAHRRLSIIDLSDAGAQPMVSASGRYVLSFNGERISVSVPPGGEPADHRAMVNQEIYSNTGKVYLVQYSLRESRDAGWQVNNVTVDGANLGQMYRTQFATLVEQAKGDVDTAIDNWGKRDGQ